MLKQYIATAKIVENNTDIGIRILHIDSGKLYDVGFGQLVNTLLNNGDVIENIELVGGKLVGSNGALSRLPVINKEGLLANKGNYKAPVIVINSVGKDGYRISDYQGKIITVRTDNLIAYCEKWGISNGKLVQKNGAPYISAISGAYVDIPLSAVVKSAETENKGSKAPAQAKETILPKKVLTSSERIDEYKNMEREVLAYCQYVAIRGDKLAVELPMTIKHNNRELIIPDGAQVLSRGLRAREYPGIRYLILPNGLEVIGDYALKGFVECTCISIPKTVKVIGKQAIKNKELTFICETGSFASGWARKTKKNYIEADNIEDMLEFMRLVDRDKELELKKRESKEEEEAAACKTSITDAKISKSMMVLMGVPKLPKLSAEALNDFQDSLEVMAKLATLTQIPGGNKGAEIDALPNLLSIPLSNDVRTRLNMGDVENDIRMGVTHTKIKTRDIASPDTFLLGRLKLAMLNRPYTRILDIPKSSNLEIDTSILHKSESILMLRSTVAMQLKHFDTNEVLSLDIFIRGDRIVYMGISNDVVPHYTGSSYRDLPPISSLCKVGDSMGMEDNSGLVKLLGGVPIPNTYYYQIVATIQQGQWLQIDSKKRKNSYLDVCGFNVVDEGTQKSCQTEMSGTIKQIIKGEELCRILKIRDNEYEARVRAFEDAADFGGNSLENIETDYESPATIEYLIGKRLRELGIDTVSKTPIQLINALFETCWASEKSYDEYLRLEAGLARSGTLKTSDDRIKIYMYRSTVALRMEKDKSASLKKGGAIIRLAAVMFNGEVGKVYAMSEEPASIISLCRGAANCMSNQQFSRWKDKLDNNMGFCNQCIKVTPIREGVPFKVYECAEYIPKIVIESVSGTPWLIVQRTKSAGGIPEPHELIMQILKFRELSEALRWSTWMNTSSSVEFKDVLAYALKMELGRNYAETLGKHLVPKTREVEIVVQSVINDKVHPAVRNSELMRIVARQKKTEAQTNT